MLFNAYPAPINKYVDDSFIKRSSHLEQRQRLGLSAPLPRPEPRHFPSEPASALQKVEVHVVLIYVCTSFGSDLLYSFVDYCNRLRRQSKMILFLI